MRVVLGVSGGIAAYKAPDVVRRLQDAGAETRVILTTNAARFVSPLSLAAVSNHPVISDQWGDPSRGGVDHIEIARWADVLLIAPASADIIAKLALGIADDALSTYALAHRGVVAIAPAMNTVMLHHPTVRDNLETLRRRGVHVIDSDSGVLACGDEGEGRMPDPPILAEFVLKLMQKHDLSGQRILVTAGPTREAIDPVRFISNRSSGKMGYALAEAAVRRGASVTLITGPTSLHLPAGVEVIRVTTAAEMHRAVVDHAEQNKVLIKAAAVADFTPEAASDTKIKRGEQETLSLKLRATPDILESVSRLDKRPFIVAFAAETNDVLANAEKKLKKKNADLIIANDVSDPSIGFDSDQNEVVIIDREGEREKLARSSKRELADKILDVILRRITTPDREKISS